MTRAACMLVSQHNRVKQQLIHHAHNISLSWGTSSWTQPKGSQDDTSACTSTGPHQQRPNCDRSLQVALDYPSIVEETPSQLLTAHDSTESLLPTRIASFPCSICSRGGTSSLSTPNQKQNSRGQLYFSGWSAVWQHWIREKNQLQRTSEQCQWWWAGDVVGTCVPLPQGLC